MEPLRVKPARSFLSGYEENYSRVIFILFGLAYLFSYYYKGPDSLPLKEFLIPRNLFTIIPLVLIAASYFIDYVKERLKDIASIFFLIATLHLIGFFSINNFNTHYEIGIITLVLFSNLHLNKTLYIVLYNVIVLTALEYVFITASDSANIQPVLFFLFLLTVMLICIFYQLYRIRYNNEQNEKNQLMAGLIEGNPDAWILFEGVGLIAQDASETAQELFQITNRKILEETSLRNILTGGNSEEIIRKILSSTVSNEKVTCKTVSGRQFQANLTSFRVPGKNSFFYCRFTDTSSDASALENATINALQYRSYLDLSDTGYTITDSAGVIKIINRKAISLLNLDPKQNYTGKNIFDLLDSDISESLKQQAENDSENQIFYKNLKLSSKSFDDLIDTNESLFLKIEESRAQGTFETPVIDLLSKSALPVALILHDGSFVNFNSSFSELAGYAPDDLKRLRLDTLVHPEDSRKIQKLSEEGNSVTLKIINGIGSTIWTKISSTKIEDKNRESFMLLLIENISQSHLNQTALERINADVTAVIENTDEPIVSVDFNHRVTVVNMAYRELMVKLKGKSISKGDDYRNILDEESKIQWESIFNKVLAGQRVKIDEIVDFPEDKTEYFETSYHPVININGLVTGVSVVSRNITERIRFEKELLKAKETAEAATSAKSGFLATMSHEIRTPLNGLIGMSELLGTTRLNEKQKEYLDAIKLSGESLLSIINDVLDYSKIESEKMELDKQPFELRKCVEETFDILYYKSLEKQNSLKMEIEESLPEFVIGDKARLRQILVNLVGNANKFTENGSITVSINRHLSQSNDLDLLFTVKDTGVGITQEQMSRLFTSFSQADVSTYGKYGGTGLGLSISKRLVGLMGGQIWVESEPGKGSSFFFTIKSKEATPNVGDIEKRRTAKLEGINLLLLSDNEFSRSKITSNNLEWRANLRTVTEAPEVEREIKSGLFDAILIDSSSKAYDANEILSSCRKTYHGPVLIFNSDQNIEADFNSDQHITESIKDLPSITKFPEIIIQLIKSGKHETVASYKTDSQLGTKLPLKILVAEDNTVNQTLIRMVMEKLGYAIDIVDNGEKALKEAEKSKYDLIFMDVQMPEMNGLEATTLIRERGKNIIQPIIIAMTAFAMEGDREKCMQAGMDDYISKPIKIEEIQKMLIKWSENQRSIEVSESTGNSELIDQAIIKRLREMSEGDPTFLNQLSTLYFTQSQNTINDLIQADKLEAISQAAHKLKGSSLNLGAQKLADLCRQIEIKCKESNEEEVQKLVQQVQGVFQETKAALTAIFT